MRLHAREVDVVILKMKRRAQLVHEQSIQHQVRGDAQCTPQVARCDVDVIYLLP